MDNILTIDKIEKYYGSKSSLTKAIDGISFEVEKGEFFNEIINVVTMLGGDLNDAL